jgi:hypothetical protein
MDRCTAVATLADVALLPLVGVAFRASQFEVRHIAMASLAVLLGVTALQAWLLHVDGAELLPVVARGASTAWHLLCADGCGLVHMVAATISSA